MVYEHPTEGPQYQRVTVREGIRYGLSIFGYLLGVVILGGAPAAFGYYAGGAGSILYILSILILAAGVVALLFKIIADAVAAGLVIYNEGRENINAEKP